MNVVRFGTSRLLSVSFLTATSPCRGYAFKSDLKIKWVRPEKIPCYKPEKSGDLAAFTPADQKLIQPFFQNSQELATADETVKKLFSLEFAPRNRTTRAYCQEMMQKVKRHPYDVGSVEVKIAKWTGIIRTFQELMDRFPRNRRLKVKLKELIDQRKKQMKHLRRWDYKRFEWLLQTLDLVYKPPPSEFRWVVRKESLVKLTNKYCDELKQSKLEEYKSLLEEQQPLFLEEKIRALEFIQQEQVDCGAEVSVTQEEIDDVKKQLDKLLQEREQKKRENDSK